MTFPLWSSFDYVVLTQMLSLYPGPSLFHGFHRFLGIISSCVPVFIEFEQGILLLCHIPNILRCSINYFLMLTFRYNISLLCFISLFLLFSINFSKILIHCLTFGCFFLHNFAFQSILLLVILCPSKCENVYHCE